MRLSTTSRYATYSISIVLSIIWTGCHDPAHQQRVSHRLNNMERMAGTIRQIENESGPSMQRTTRMLTHLHEDDIMKTRRMPRTVNNEIRYDFDHWKSRQAEGNKTIRELLEGNSNNIRNTIPEILY